MLPELISYDHFLRYVELTPRPTSSPCSSRFPILHIDESIGIRAQHIFCFLHEADSLPFCFSADLRSYSWSVAHMSAPQPFGSRHFSSDNNSIVVVVEFELSAGIGVVVEENFYFLLDRPLIAT